MRLNHKIFGTIINIPLFITIEIKNTRLAKANESDELKAYTKIKY